jgi:transcriptional regulator with XRE-family HTH domain
MIRSLRIYTRRPKMKIANLAEYKEKKGLTSRDLAELLGISESYLSEVLSGKRSFSKKLASRVSEKTGIPLLNILYPEIQRGDQN